MVNRVKSFVLTSSKNIFFSGSRCVCAVRSSLLFLQGAPEKSLVHLFRRHASHSCLLEANNQKKKMQKKKLTRSGDIGFPSPVLEVLVSTDSTTDNSPPPKKKFDSRAVPERMRFTLHAIRRTPHGASRLVQSNVCLVGENPTSSVPAL